MDGCLFSGRPCEFKISPCYRVRLLQGENKDKTQRKPAFIFSRIIFCDLTQLSFIDVLIAEIVAERTSSAGKKKGKQ